MTKKKAFALRISPELYAALERWAADELRSVNGQIEFLLWEALRRSGRQTALKPPGAKESVKEARRVQEEGEG